MVMISSSLGISSIVWTFTLYFSWVFSIYFGYKFKKWWKGLIIGYTIWLPTIIITVLSSPYEDLGLAFGIKIIMATLAAILGAISGYIGGRK